MAREEITDTNNPESDLGMSTHIRNSADHPACRSSTTVVHPPNWVLKHPD